MPGRATEYVCSMPAIWLRTCSAGRATMFCTSSLLAPGKAISTLAIVTLICGSSSRGVTITAKRPSSNATSARSGVIALSWNVAAMRPEIPSFSVVVVCIIGPYCLAEPDGAALADGRAPANPALIGSMATRSPVETPASTSMPSVPKSWPSRTTLSTKPEPPTT